MPSMHPLNEYFQAAMAPYAGKRFLVACSGGLDSMALAHLALTNGMDVELAHVNYGLRGADSMADEAFVRTFAEHRKVVLHVKTVDPDTLEGNLQAATRDLRYAWFEELLQSKSLDFVLLAHHRDDQVETFYMNLGRSSGFMGLSCMPFQRDQMLRPLLDVDKDTLHAYALTHSLPWREDASNASLKYARNRLRLEFLPRLYEQIPDLKESVGILIDHFQAAQVALDTRIRPLVEGWLQTRTLEISQWQALDTHEKVEVLRQLSQSASLMKHLDQLASAAKGAQLPLAPGAAQGFSAIVREAAHFRLIVKLRHTTEVELRIEAVEALPAHFDKQSLYLDEGKITGELRVRTWRQGDRIASVGMKGSQLISEIISDAAVPFDQKDAVIVVHDDVHIHWCPGLKIGRLALAEKDQRGGILRCTILQATVPEWVDRSKHRDFAS